jgi:hypothetical protein
MSSKSVAPHKHPKTRSPTEAWVAEPDLNDCNPNARWRIRLIRSQITAKFEIEIRFRTRDKQLDLLLIDNAAGQSSTSSEKSLSLATSAYPMTGMMRLISFAS